MGADTGAGCATAAPVSYAFYLDAYGGTLGADAWRRATCAAADAFAEYGEGRVGGFEIGAFKVTNYRDDGTTGADVAREAAIAELSGTGLLWSGVR